MCPRMHPGGHHLSLDATMMSPPWKVTPLLTSNRPYKEGWWEGGGVLAKGCPGQQQSKEGTGIELHTSALRCNCFKI